MQAQQRDQREARLWIRFLGGQRDLERELDDEQLQVFVELRRSGEMDSCGNFPVALSHRRAVRDRTIEADIQWLRSLIHCGDAPTSGPRPIPDGSGPNPRLQGSRGKECPGARS